MPMNKTNILAIDCEMVGIGHQSMLARVSIVNKYGNCIYDKFVKPRKEVNDYRTFVSGVRARDLLNGEEFEVVKQAVSTLIKDGILVGHSVGNDLRVLGLSHPKQNIRDISEYPPFKKVTYPNTPSLNTLAITILGINIQTGEHSSVKDAKVAMQLYSKFSANWEASLSR